MNEEKIESENVQKTSLKGVIIFLIIFGIIAVTFTSMYANLFNQTNNSTKGENVTQNTSGENEKIEEIIPVVDTKYVSEYDDMYFLNSIEITTKNYTSGDFIKKDYDGNVYEENVSYFQIDGLKDEELERKINERIKNDAFKLLELSNDYKIKDITMYTEANYSNILSCCIRYNFYNDYSYEENSIGERKYINIDLSTGNDIKFEELFLEGISIKNIIADEIYSSNQYIGESWEYYEYLYSKTKNEDYYLLEDEEIKKMGLMTLDEWENWYKKSRIEEDSLKFMYEIGKNNFDFYITGGSIAIDLENLYCSIDIRDNLKSLALFKRFMKEESIFTNEYPSEKGLCGFYIEEYRSAERVMDNLFLSYSEFSTEDLYYTKMLEEKTIAEKEYARLTPEKMYFVAVCLETDYASSAKIEMSKKEFENNKDEILKTFNPYCLESYMMWDGGDTIIDITMLDELGIDYIYSGVHSYNRYSQYEEERLYTLNDSDKEVLDVSRLEKLSEDDLNIAYNEIFARHGHDFKSKELRKHFIGCLWYTPIYGKTVSLEELNEIEKQNVEIIKNEINRRKGI